MLEKRPQQRGWRWKRTAMIAMLLLAGGAVVNVAVAWGLAIAANPYEGFYEDEWCLNEHNQISIVFRFERAGTSLIQLQQYVYDVYYDEPIPPKAKLPFPGTLLPNSSWLSRRPFFYERVSRLIARQSGLPLKSLESVFLHPSVPDEMEPRYQQWVPFEMRFGVPLPLDPWPHKGTAVTPRALPLRPLLPGLIINTLFYAIILWLLFAAPFAARRKLRRRRGLCEKCAYPIGTSPVCTECGAAVRVISFPQEATR